MTDSRQPDTQTDKIKTAERQTEKKNKKRGSETDRKTADRQTNRESGR